MIDRRPADPELGSHWPAGRGRERRLRIAILVDSLGSGGAEGVVTRLSREWARRGDEVSVLTFAEPTRDFFATDEAVRRVALAIGSGSDSRGSLAAGLAANLRRVRALRSALAGLGPDLMVSFVDRTNVLALLASLGTGLPAAISERTDPRLHRLEQPWAALRALSYRRAHRLIVPHEGLRSWAEGQGRAERVLVLPNPVDLPPLEDELLSSTAGPGADRPRVVGVGRFSPEKGFDRLVLAFAEIAERIPGWSLMLTGDGPERPRVEGLVVARELSHRVEVRTARADPWTGSRPGDVFVLPSRYEGLSNALLEAMVRGLVPVVTPAAGGRHGVVVDGESGIVTTDDSSEAIAHEILRLSADPALRLRLARAARRRGEVYESAGVAEQWRGALLDMLMAAGQDRDRPNSSRHRE